MKFISIASDLLINPDHIVSMEKKKSGKVIITTTDGKQNIVERDFKQLLPELIRAGVDCPDQFWAG